MRPFDPAILRLLPAARRPVLLLGLLGMAAGVLAIAQAFAIAAVVVAVVHGSDLTRPALALLAIAAARAVTGSAVEASAARAGIRVSTALREALLGAALVRSGRRDGTGSIGGTDSTGRSTDDTGSTAPDTTGAAASALPTADLRTLSVEGASSVEPYVARFLPTLISAAVLPLLAIATIALVDWPSALIVVCTVPLLPLFAALIGRATAEATQRRWQALRALSGHFLDVVRGLPVLVSYGRADRQVTEIRRVGERHRSTTMATLRLAFLSSAALELLATISVAMVAVAVGLRLSAGHLTLHTGLLAILLAPEAYWPIRRVGAEFHAAADGAAAIADAVAVLAPTDQDDCRRHTGRAPRDHVDQTPSADPVVRASDLGYRYPGAGRDALTDVELTAGTGLTAVTGPSGCGKSTLLELLAGLRIPTTGWIQAPPAHLVSQRPFLIPGTIRENLLLPGDRSDARIRDALAEVGLGPLIDALPRGLDTVLGDDGFGLSAGQRARLGLARALLTDAPVILLDEPTAHLDPEATATVQAAIRRLADTRIVVAATHRSGLLALADREYPMAVGRAGMARPLPAGVPS